MSICYAKNPPNYWQKGQTEEETNKLRVVQLDLVKETSELRGAYDHLATKEDVAKSTLTQVKWLIGVVAVPTVITLINMIIQLTG